MKDVTICEKCGEPMEFFGTSYVFTKGKKWKKTFRNCTKHIPYTQVRCTKMEIVE